MNQDDIDNTPDQQGWWDDTDVTRLIDPKAFRRFLYSYDQLLKNSDSDGEDNEVISRVSGTSTEPSPDEQPKLGQSPSTKG
jgi:hypothetical protein